MGLVGEVGVWGDKREGAGTATPAVADARTWRYSAARNWGVP